MSDTMHASDRLQEDKQLVESAARRLMDSITGEWGCEGQPFVPEICSAVQTMVDAVGRFGHAVEKAALDMYARAPQCYIDREGASA